MNRKGAQNARNVSYGDRTTSAIRGRPLTTDANWRRCVFCSRAVGQSGRQVACIIEFLRCRIVTRAEGSNTTAGYSVSRLPIPYIGYSPPCRLLHQTVPVPITPRGDA